MGRKQMKKISLILSLMLISVIHSGCSVVDWGIGGVGSTHITRFELDVSSNGGLRESSQLLDKDRSIVLEQVKAVAHTHHFVDKSLNIGGEPRPIAYFATSPPWLCMLKIFETNNHLTVELWQYYEKRNKTHLYKDTETALTDKLKNHFSDRLEVRYQRQLRYPWQSD